VIDFAAYAGLFLTAFIAATILPLQSEAALAALLLSGDYPAWLLLLVASIGNVAGSVVNWGLGLAIERVRDRKWFPVKPAALARAQVWYHRYGRWTLLLSWLPIVGDPLTVAAGIMRERLIIFVALVTVAKVGRYLIVAAIILRWFASGP
jgi:membrane protein YqaA with SNARE-associated domain